MQISSLNRRRRGATLVETTISIAIISLLFSSSASTFIMAARATHAMQIQNRNQIQCTMAMERVVNLLRNATVYEPCTGDDPKAGELNRIRFAIPVDTDVYNLAWGTISYEATESKSPDGERGIGMVKLTWDKNYAFNDGVGFWNNGNMSLKGITDFKVAFESDQRVQLSMAFLQPSIKNRAMDHLDDGVFKTQVTAKNHILLEGLDLGGENETLALQF